jgi:hypothetical protein
MQGDSGGKVNILRGDNLRKKVHRDMRQILIGYRGTAVRIHEYKSVVNSNEEK